MMEVLFFLILGSAVLSVPVAFIWLVQTGKLRFREWIAAPLFFGTCFPLALIGDFAYSLTSGIHTLHLSSALFFISLASPFILLSGFILKASPHRKRWAIVVSTALLMTYFHSRHVVERRTLDFVKNRETQMQPLALTETRALLSHSFSNTTVPTQSVSGHIPLGSNVTWIGLKSGVPSIATRARALNYVPPLSRPPVSGQPPVPANYTPLELAGIQPESSMRGLVLLDWNGNAAPGSPISIQSTEHKQTGTGATWAALARSSPAFAELEKSPAFHRNAWDASELDHGTWQKIRWNDAPVPIAWLANASKTSSGKSCAGPIFLSLQGETPEHSEIALPGCIFSVTAFELMNRQFLVVHGEQWIPGPSNEWHFFKLYEIRPMPSPAGVSSKSWQWVDRSP